MSWLSHHLRIFTLQKTEVVLVESWFDTVLQPQRHHCTQTIKLYVTTKLRPVTEIQSHEPQGPEECVKSVVNRLSGICMREAQGHWPCTWLAFMKGGRPFVRVCAYLYLYVYHKVMRKWCPQAPLSLMIASLTSLMFSFNRISCTQLKW